MRRSVTLTFALVSLCVISAIGASSQRAEAAFAHFQEFLALRGLESVGLFPSPQQPLGKASQTAPARTPDNAEWNAPFFPKGPSRFVHALEVRGSEVIAGGDFIGADEGLAANVARWDGTGWKPLGKGINSGGNVYDLDQDWEGRIYAAGFFDSAGTKACRGVARWDGADWQCMELYNGIDRGVTALTLQGDQWNSLSTVSNPGLSFPVEIMASQGSELFLGGRYLMFAGSLPVSGIAKWDGSKWDSLGGGFKIPSDAVNFLDLNVNAIAPSGNQVYAGGRFDSSQSGPALNIARWDGKAWHPLGAGFPGVVNDIVPADVGVFTGGRADTSALAPGSSPIAGQAVARWDGQAWQKLGLGLQGEVKKLIRFGNDLYAAGRLRRTGEDSTFGILKWNGEKWLTLDWGLSQRYDSAFALTQYSGNLHILGRIRGGSASECLLTSWNAQGLVSQEEITHGISLASDNEFLYLLLQSSTQEIAALRGASVARWNATQGWQALLTGIGGFYFVYHGEIATLVPSLAVHANHLYVSGRFTEPMNGMPVHYLARWNRTGVIGTRRPGLRPHAADQGPLVFLSGFSDRGLDGGWKIFDPLGRALPVWERRAGGKGVTGTQGVRILLPLVPAPE